MPNTYTSIEQSIEKTNKLSDSDKKVFDLDSFVTPKPDFDPTELARLSKITCQNQDGERVVLQNAKQEDVTKTVLDFVGGEEGQEKIKDALCRRLSANTSGGGILWAGWDPINSLPQQDKIQLGDDSPVSKYPSKLEISLERDKDNSILCRVTMLVSAVKDMNTAKTIISHRDGLLRVDTTYRLTYDQTKDTFNPEAISHNVTVLHEQAKMLKKMPYLASMDSLAEKLGGKVKEQEVVPMQKIAINAQQWQKPSESNDVVTQFLHSETWKKGSGKIGIVPSPPSFDKLKRLSEHFLSAHPEIRLDAAKAIHEELEKISKAQKNGELKFTFYKDIRLNVLEEYKTKIDNFIQNAATPESSRRERKTITSVVI